MNEVRSLRPSPSMVVAFVALIVASGGTAVAATLITSKQIKDGTIQLVDISKSAKAALKGNAGLQGPQGPQGVAGTQGPQGLAGVQGPAGPVNVHYQDGTEVVGTALSPEILQPVATCPAGQVVIGGGVFTGAGLGDVAFGAMVVQEDGPFASVTGGRVDSWGAVVQDTSTNATGAAFARVTAICTTATNVTP